MSKLNVISEDTDNSITETSSYYSAIDDASLNESSLKPYVRKTGSICIQPSEFNDKQNKGILNNNAFIVLYYFNAFCIDTVRLIRLESMMIE